MRYLKLQGEKKASKYCYKIADSFYQTDILLKGLEYLIQAPLLFGLHDKKTSNRQHDNSFSRTTFLDDTLIGENNYSLHVSINTNGDYQLKNQSDIYIIGSNTITARITKIDFSLLFGPVILLQLAMNKVFCLHASAFILKNTCFIFMADSGTGKSTLARYIQENQLGERLADDMLPIKIINKKITLLPHFPQLKLNQDQQYNGSDICQKTVLIFAKKSETKSNLSRVENFTSIKNLIKHSVATKLFSENELRNHLKFCHDISEKTQAYQLNYQHSEKSLNELHGLLNEIA